jgi:hypothetical protein
MMSGAPGTAELLLAFVLPLAVVSLVMVYAMVQWSETLLDLEPPPPGWSRRRRWGAAYVGCWLVILLLFARFLGSAEGGFTARNLGMLALVVGGWWGLHALIIAFGRAIGRANARAAAGPPAPAGEEEESEAPGPAAPEAPSALSTGAAGTPGGVRQALGWGASVAVALLAITLGELSPAMKALEDVMARHQPPLLAVAIGMAALGFVLFMGGLIHLMLTGGQPMTHVEVEEMARQSRDLSARPYVWRRSTYRIRGRTVGAQAEDAASFSEIKAAWRSGAWRRSRRWRRMFVILTGGLLMTFGIFGIPFVVGPAGIKLVVGAAMVYVLVQLVRGFWRA